MEAELLILEAGSEGGWRMEETYCFQKADLDYTQCGLEKEIKTSHPGSAGEKNPITILKESPAIKS